MRAVEWKGYEKVGKNFGGGNEEKGEKKFGRFWLNARYEEKMRESLDSWIFR
ncbi:MAG: hypothetical protein IJ679_00430 [Lachnospiraceae bacterium]|nr:hypothetical protein [Lachnospiraceae bacterium]